MNSESLSLSLSLSYRLVRLMTAAGGSQGCEGMAAEFLFVLCKEDSARLIKYTGYGNAAGLLLTHGLLGNDSLNYSFLGNQHQFHGYTVRLSTDKGLFFL